LRAKNFLLFFFGLGFLIFFAFPTIALLLKKSHHRDTFRLRFPARRAPLLLLLLLLLPPTRSARKTPSGREKARVVRDAETQTQTHTQRGKDGRKESERERESFF
jgi:hypothetical protein